MFIIRKWGGINIIFESVYNSSGSMQFDKMGLLEKGRGELLGG